MKLDAGWVQHAACRDTNPDLFFPPESNYRTNISANNIDRQRRESADALDYCQTCPAVADCLAWALAVPERFGVWGNTVELERRKIRSEASRHGTAVLWNAIDNARRGAA